MMRKILKRRVEHDRGYILLLAILISSVILSIGLGVYSLGLKQFILSAFLSDSQRALSAADRGVECFMYWDSLFRNTTPPLEPPFTMFPSDNSAPVFPPNQDVAVCSGQQLNASTKWSTNVQTAANATTRFNLSFTDGTCVDVEVFRTTARTRVTADGFSDCNPNNLRRAQRRLEAVAAF
jgi:Tfp pilus assembly protein PilX